MQRPPFMRSPDANASSERVDVPEGADQTSGALVGPAFRWLVAGPLGRTGRPRVLACLPRRRGLGVQRLRDFRRTPGVAQPQYLEFEHLLAPGDPQRIAHPHCARGLRALPAHLDLAGLDRLPREAAGLEEPRGPQPQVQADAFVVFG